MDEQLFSADAVPVLREAVRDLSWLRTRGYAQPSALKLVGDRYQLRKRQRIAAARCACSDQAQKLRASHRLDPEQVAGRPLHVDGLNVITSIEVALAGGVLLLGRDSCLRDMASFHGSYRLVQETDRALRILIAVIDAMHPSEARIYIDRPVSNSGRLAETVRAIASAEGSSVEALTADRVDETLKASDGVVASSDSAILDTCGAWVNLARLAIERHCGEEEPLWLLELSLG